MIIPIIVSYINYTNNMRTFATLLLLIAIATHSTKSLDMPLFNESILIPTATFTCLK